MTWHTGDGWQGGWTQARESRGTGRFTGGQPGEGGGGETRRNPQQGMDRGGKAPESTMHQTMLTERRGGMFMQQRWGDQEPQTGPNRMAITMLHPTQANPEQQPATTHDNV